MNEFTMPYQKEKEQDEKGSSRDVRIYKPLPDKAGMIVNNDVIIPLFSPHTWKLFNPTPEDAAKYGMVGSGLVSMNPSDPIYTFYFRLPVHNIQNFNHPDGSVKRFAQVVCPVAMNRYLVESLGRGPLFDQPRCAFCEQEQRHWDAFNARWDNCGTDKRSLSKEGYWKFIDNDAILSAEREAARKFGVDTRFVINVFDHAKFVGTRPKDDGEEQVQHQIWFAPKSIYQKLLQLYEAGGPGGFRFFEPIEGHGFPILFVVKNTSECKAGDLRNTKYDVGFVNRYYPYPPEWIAYLQNAQAMVDPSDFVHLLTYEEARYYVAAQQTSTTEYGGAPAQQFAPPPGGGYQAPPSGMPQGFAPPAGPPPGMPSGSVSPDGYAAPGGVMPPGAPPMGAPPMGAPPMGAPPMGAPPMGAPPMQQQPPGAPPMGAPPMGAPPMQQQPPGAPPAAPGGAPIPTQPPAGQPPSTATPGGPVQVVAPIETQGAPPPGAPPMGTPPAVQPPYGAPPMGAPPQGAPPAGYPYGTPPGAPPAAMPPQGAPMAAPGSPPPMTAPAQGQPPDRTPPAGEEPPGRRRSW